MVNDRDSAPRRSTSPDPPRDARAPGARRGTNLPRVADYNQMLVLDLVRKTPGISRVELVQHTGLTPQTLSNISRRLLDAGLIRESGRESVGTGAPRTLFEVEATGRYSVGLHIDPARLTCIVLDLAGDVVASTVRPTPKTANPADVIEEISAVIGALVENMALPPDRIAGIGVATPGPLDVSRGVVIDAPNLPGWEHVDLRQDLEARMGYTVIVEKDATAAALGETWSSHAASRNMAFVYLGTGVAAGIVLGGEVARGASSNIGDIGHMSGAPNGPLCYCGGRGCLATTAMPASIVGDAVGRGALPPLDLDDARAVEVALAELGRMAIDDGAEVAVEILDHVAHSFGRVAGQLANALDLDAIVFGGPEWPTFEPSFLRVVPREVDNLFVHRALHDVVVRGTSIGEHVGAVGAASLAMWSTTFDAPRQLFLPH